ncbi:MAG: YihY/virulence factor BrkB family protein, partial [Deltaproteobacteria bacterium]|nr:YihY/virulence factor BrkB family protein [Deltaproteobacteria bacterium]
SLMFEKVIAEVVFNQRAGLLSFALLMTLWTATSGIVAAMDHLNRIYRVQEIRGWVKTRLIAFFLMLLFTAMILGVFVMLIIASLAKGYVQNFFHWPTLTAYAFSAFQWIIAFLMINGTLSLIYHWGPNIKRKFQWFTYGSLFGTLFMMMGTLAFRLYLKNFGHYDKIYGSIGGVIIFMLWLKMCGLALLSGAKINATSWTRKT